jgi:serine/threonine-protein kinase ULK/ATG1
MRRTD